LAEKMTFRFDRFQLDPHNRRLSCGQQSVELNSRYLDALMLLVRERGRLVSKDRFLEEVWRGVPVTDEALTQCIRTLRRQLGDDAASPRFIETVPKHGYRFVAEVSQLAQGEGDDGPAPVQAPAYDWRKMLLVGLAGTVGGGLAGVVGGLFYGFVGASQPAIGAVSVVIVLMCLTILAALIGAAGVAFGIAVAGLFSSRFWQWSVAGGSVGGLVVGASAKLLGLDAFHLLVGRSPGDITGAVEGLFLGAAVGLGGWLAARMPVATPVRRRAAVAALAGGATGVLIPLAGGRLMGGSLDLLASQFPESRLRMNGVGTLFGEQGFGPISQLVTGGLEGALFAACVVGAMMIARRDLGLR
jgi:DNA-binding winged helix-turn-helix (wHTH) protein